MSRQSEAVKKWRKNTKDRIVLSMGGKCQICGYNKCVEALELHHIDPKIKSFQISNIRAIPKSWMKIICELRKCILLCSNCHKEVEAGKTSMPTEFNRFDESFVEYKEVRPQNSCEQCGKLCGPGIKRRFCSPQCSKIAHRSLKKPEKEILRKLISENTWLALGEVFGVSDNSVRKWARSYGLI